ncbi:MAG: TraG protein [uncultured bacterium]|nr:MAG: TraG protein [uncultured bacterium]
MMRGMTTEQLGTGVLRTSRPDGETTYDSSHALSKLPVNVRSSEMLSTSFSEQAEAARTASVQDQIAYDQSMSSAVSDFSSLGKTLSSNKSMGESFSSREAASAAQNTSDMQNLTKTIANRNHVDVNDVFRGLANFSQGATLSIGGSISGKALGINVADGKLGLDGKISTEHTRSQESSTQHGIGRSIDITAEEANRFSNDLHKVEEYSKTTHAETNKSEATSHLSQLSTDLRNARSASEQYSVHKAESERLSNAASYVRQHSGQIDSDLGQEIANSVVQKEGREEAERLFAGKDRPKLEALAKEHLRDSGVESSIISAYQQGSASINPNQKYQSGQANLDARSSGINMDHAENKQKLLTDAKAQEIGVDQQQFDEIIKKVGSGSDGIKDQMKEKDIAQKSEYNMLNAEVAKDIKEGSEKAESSAFDDRKDFIKPNFTKLNKKEK